MSNACIHHDHEDLALLLLDISRLARLRHLGYKQHQTAYFVLPPDSNENEQYAKLVRWWGSLSADKRIAIIKAAETNAFLEGLT